VQTFVASSPAASPRQGDQIGRIFLPIGQLFTLGEIWKISEVAIIFWLFFPQKKYVLILTK
jgi:hypothetical protein